METNPALEPPAPKPATPTPEYTPQKSPQPLARNFEQRVKQLDIIAQNPSDNQVKLIADKFRADNPDTEDAEGMARNAFENMGVMVKERTEADQAVKQARREALAAPRDQFKSRVEALREAERRRSEINSTLRNFSDDFKDAGIVLEGSQQPLGLMDKVSKKAYETGWQMAAGAQRVGETVKEGAQGLIELGRRGWRALVSSGADRLNQAQEKGSNTFNNVKAKAEAGKSKVGFGLGRLGEAFRGAKEVVGRKISEARDAASVWISQRRGEIATRVGKARESVETRLSELRVSAGARIDSFTRPMREMGEAARKKMDEVGVSLHKFASEQATRIDNLRKEIGERVRGEISMAVAKTKIFLEPAWESVQKDRESIRENKDMMMEKLGIMVEGVSDLASPIIDRILDQGRDARDAALGFTDRHTQGLRVFGRNALTSISESDTWKFMQERWESLRLRSNESRARLNTFLNASLGNMGERFKPLTEAVSARAKRAASLLTGVRIENGYIVHGDGVRVSDEVSEWFMQQGTTAKEFLKRGKEGVSGGLDMLRRYWEIYAVGKWTEAGLSGVDVKRRLKILRAAGAASMGRAAHGAGRVASLGTAAGLEGAAMLGSLAKDKKGKVALTVAALALALAVSPELRDGLQNMLGSVDLSGLGLPDFGIRLGGAGIDAVSPQPGGIDIGSIPAPDISSIGVPDVSGIPSIVPTPTPDILPPGGVSLPDVASAVSNIPSPDTLINSFTPGQPLEAQAREIAGGVNETYYKLLQGGFDQFKDNFLTTAQTIVNNASNYSPEQVSIAQDQLNAAARLDQDPTLIQGTQAWYDTIMKAAHFWRP